MCVWGGGGGEGLLTITVASCMNVSKPILSVANYTDGNIFFSFFFCLFVFCSFGFFFFFFFCHVESSTHVAIFLYAAREVRKKGKDWSFAIELSATVISSETELQMKLEK